MKNPLVSCLMLTYNRFKPFKSAVYNFMNQTHDNKELIIVNSGDDNYIKKVDKFLSTIDTTNIRVIVQTPTTLGELRNNGLDECSGEYVMIFDDDDYHNSERIKRQLSLCLTSESIHGTLLRNFKAVYKNKWFGKKKYNCTMLAGLEGTLLFKLSDIRYPDMNQGEDTTFLQSLKDGGHNIVIIDEPYELYEYNFHGGNTVNKRHFEIMINNNKPLRSEL